ncbi:MULTISPECIES: universal stress protein [Cupriavidus]|uniref:Nucleotide-binding universal stress protein, UspA family n=1 Tax=Cupriavidus taiwanensis TaxID=164546 RepID=A0A375CUG5_9BURK|nr:MULTISPECIES: universal stress protein [Cupriavidus]MEC3765618.1 universal stress protein [Cupriavidus sp. SS-3]SOY79639.1 putative universal stress protein, UspA family [Cupriavidus taiwanensis]SOY81611.1 putative universal stress protein, UspA family [Cupriavidus taiwanensis]SPD64856.1 Nucleotide-binding universal stress protein, UspA family [Cupriavidus taiwanensis]
MFKHILLATDGSELSRMAMEAAIGFVKADGARLTAYTCMEEYPYLASGDAGHPRRKAFEEQEAERARARLEEVVAAARAAGVPCATDMTATVPYKGIIDAAARHECDVIFMASHGRRGLDALLVGSETQKVLTHCRVPVLVYR